MGNRPSSGDEGTHVAEILQSPRTEDEAKILGDCSGAQHVRQEEVIRQQPTTRATEATSYSLFDPYHNRKSEALATTPRTALHEDSAYGTKPDTTLSCPKDLRTEAKRRMTEWDENETLLPSGIVDWTKISIEAIAALSSADFEDDLFVSPMTQPKASTLRERRRTEGSKGRGQSEDMV